MQYNHLARLYFMHVPKNAGTTVFYWLRELFDDAAICPANHFDEFRRLVHDEQHLYRLYSGHFGAIQDATMGIIEDTSTFTMLRRPVDREKSVWRYLNGFGETQIALYGQGTWATSRLIAATKESSLGELYAKPDFLNLYANGQTRWIGTVEGSAPEHQPVLDLETLNRAKERLLRIRSFGIVEDMLRSSLLLSSEFGLPWLPITGRENMSRVSGEVPVDADVDDLVGKGSALDVELYRFATEVFEARYEAMLGKIGIPQSAAPEDVGAAVDAHFNASTPVTPRYSSFRASQSNGLVARGFDRRFFYEPARRWLRWTKADTTPTIWLPIDRSGARNVTFEAIYLRGHPKWGVAVNGNRVPTSTKLVQWDDGSWHTELIVRLPSMATDRAYTQFTFEPEDGETEIAFALGDIIVA